ncbi:LacI family DNA-binding transcriptional regulator [Schaalia hyovaginalis]|uniref:LacI family DNA-binding transcriptional regulator n=1 Tax=Schaalia hyovaginalis TaxID=29316 RepID=UPI002A75AB57|nr:LacI family DNA-binding transcriptional regulator [Schaalia hyovaginalis]MDY2668468.1 LacI family DNA-binding transcriptional regulator [Schaalia hyovaginalis]
MSTRRLATKKVSLADVAELAGVSTNTVSRVVRGDPEVADATRKRITTLLNEVGYRPNYAARALAAKRTGVLHVLLAAPMFHGHGRVLLSVLNAGSEAGYHVSLSNAYRADGSLGSDVAPFDVDAVVILAGQDPTVELAVDIGKRVPTVLVLTSEKGLDGISTAAIDNVKGARLATQHLLMQGVSDIIHVAGPSGWSDAAMRKQGFLQACDEYGVQGRVIESQSWNSQDGYDVMGSVRRLPEAVQTANDQLALGAMRLIHERGAGVPRDVKVVGFDDIDGADCYSPPLTTIRQPFDRLGRTAVRIARSMIEGGSTEDVTIDPELVIRASSTL